MAIDTIYQPLDLITGTVIADETYSSVGSSAWGLGEPARAFTGLVLSTLSGGGGTVLVLNTDYTLEEDERLTTFNSGTPVYRSITVLNATYQTGTLYANYTVHGSYVDSDDLLARIDAQIAPIQTEVDDLKQNLEKYVNFLVVNNSSNPTYQLDISADEIQIGLIRETAAFTTPVTVDITTVGENGRSYSAAESSSWHYLWAIAGDGKTSAFILDLSSTTPDTSNIAAGYTEFELVGWVNNPSGSFTTFSKEDYIVTLDNVSLLSSGTASSATAVSLTSILPDYTLVDRLYLNVNKTGSGNFARVMPTTSITFGALYFGESTALIGWSEASIKPKSSNIYYVVSGSSDPMSINAREIKLKI